jgi:hypothetical protein
MHRPLADIATPQGPFVASRRWESGRALAKTHLREFSSQVMDKVVKNELTFDSRSHDFHLRRHPSVT